MGLPLSPYPVFGVIPGSSTTTWGMGLPLSPGHSTPGDTVEWPGESGSPIPQVVVEDPGMTPNTVPRQGVQGHLVNPKGTPVTEYREATAPLTPDRVVIRVAPKKPRGRPRKEVRPPQQEQAKATASPTGPARNTRSRAA